ncbi:hypothetical protein [Pectobacterium versatile]|uniref:hypothetical protein n=1 Tax=Pectobacterium versatile TaxID=2488639 RepID=UPI001F1ECD41|nr:hypothetical protein [Pectobacterium versatile]
MADKPLPEAGVGTSTTLTTALIGVLSSFSGSINLEYRELYTQVIPYISPGISLLLVWIYNRFVEPPEIAILRGRFKRDLRSQRKCLKDKNMSQGAKERAQINYDETCLKISMLGRDFADGVYSKPQSSP